MKRNGFPGLANGLHLQQPSRWSVDHILSALRAIARAVAGDHAHALDAAAKAQLPRKNLAEVRAMCVTPMAPHRQDNEGASSPDRAQRASEARKVRTDWPCWSAPFPKPKK